MRGKTGGIMQYFIINQHNAQKITLLSTFSTIFRTGSMIFAYLKSNLRKILSIFITNY